MTTARTAAAPQKNSSLDLCTKEVLCISLFASASSQRRLGKNGPPFPRPKETPRYRSIRPAMGRNDRACQTSAGTPLDRLTGTHLRLCAAEPCCRMGRICQVMSGPRDPRVFSSYGIHDRPKPRTSRLDMVARHEETLVWAATCRSSRFVHAHWQRPGLIFHQTL
jgi:hypothetical protein